MASTMSVEKRFTVASANRTLPLVRAIVGDIVALYRDVAERKDRLEILKRRRGQTTARKDDPYREEVDQIQHELDKDVERLQGFVDELNEIGIELKDPVAGLVDFPSTIDGESAFLCWQLGENEVGSWHAVDAGHTDRQPLRNSPTDHAV